MGSSLIDPAILAEEAKPTLEARAIGHGPLIHYATNQVQPPSQVYVDLNTSLRVVLTKVLGGINVTLDIRILLPDGTIQIQQEIIAVTGTRSSQPFDFKMAEGFLLSVQVSASIPNHGDLFAHLALLRGGGTSTPQTWVIAHGYVTSRAPVGWPNARLEAPQYRPGLINTTFLGNPGAGLDFTLTVPAVNGPRMRIMGFQAQLVTAVAVANRQVTLVIKAAASPVMQIPVLATQAASLTVIYTWAAGISSQAAIIGGLIASVFPSDLWLLPGHTVGVVTQNLQAADQWSAIGFIQEECVEA